MRGYGGSAYKDLTLIEKGASPKRYGDEAVMLKNRYDCPVAVGRNRTAAATLLESTGVDIVISDDGLQHYALARDIEIAVLDGERGIGNGLLLPAGPLREGVGRLEEVDWVIANRKKVQCI